jgi:hypothetical protein
MSVRLFLRRAAIVASLSILICLLAGAAGQLLRPSSAEDVVEQAPVVEITLSMTSVGDISPLLYGVNYDWDRVPAAQFQQFAAAMREVAHCTLVRFPAGWNAEWYDWTTNRLTGGRHYAAEPGVDPETLLSLVPEATFITPSAEAIRNPAARADVVERSAALVRRYADRVRLWEIGNEWWLQNEAANDPALREHHLRAYSALIAAAAPAMKAANPHTQIYVTGDWQRPQEFETLRVLSGSAWSAVDGISIHSYCGPAVEERRCGRIVDSAAAIRSVTGKKAIYDSEWSVAKRLSQEDYGIRNASETILAIQDLAFAQVTAAAYWPVVKVLPALAFASGNYRRSFATGMAFGWMSQYYRGEALRTQGALAAVAAKNDAGVTIFVPARGDGPRRVRISLAGTGLRRVVSAEVMYSQYPDDPQLSRDVSIAPLPVSTHGADGQSWLEFMVNPGTPGRGVGWEIARLTLQ